ncbi:aldehyde ferredoxin oxidoreductase family protein [Dethiosulfatarculus sandiegensis]|uniref:Aldehyde ferredoxin oxidoreductase n=1 Tax=Dethiosulfatarculus sandiegensis TaxID=1429043 RepID=A0A0D2GKU4_9BACT|nr:aldehyde ferredoxin oxidoreductase C-terminal domain-containing protein [Dethiosulfatarculus sandiegensis]KIX15362.1 aldehyde ferredoxin oxidoreductase [Dethiosulfatarculus sandiegensis]
MFKILRVDMAAKSTKFEDVPEKWQGLGGRGFTSAVVADEVDPTATAIGPLNKLIFAPGLLGGTNCANSGRLSVGAKSPLTGGIKESNTGGQAGAYLAKLGIHGIIVEGIPSDDALFLLKVGKDKAELVAAGHLKGLGNYDTVAKLVQEYGDKCGYVSIGQAGENLMNSASVAFTDRELRPSRHAGRGGLGAVMGSKKLKAIVIDPEGGASSPIADKEAFKAAAKRFAKALSEHPVTSGGLPTYGTNVLTNILNEAGGLPTRNFSAGNFEGAEKVSGETLNEVTVKRGGNPTHGCMTGCMIRCSGIYVDEKGDYVSKWPEYETVWAWGPNCGIDDLDAIARIDYMCDDFGLDTIDTGCAMAVAMEAGILNFGDAKGAEKLLAEVGEGTPMGKVIGAGTATTGRVLGVSRVPVVKGQSMPAYDPRSVKGLGVTYATTPMGADHTAGYATTANILKVGGDVDPLKSQGQIELSQGLQVATASIDTAGLCLFVAFAVLDIPDALAAIVDMLNAKYGWTITADDVNDLGKKVLTIEKDFNTKAGFNKADDRLPDFFKYEKLPPHNVVFDVSDEELDKVLDF